MVMWESRIEEKLVDLVRENGIVGAGPRVKATAFRNVAAALGGPYTVKAVKERWRNIRNTYMHNFKRVQKSKEAAQNPADIYEPSWHLWDKCQFITLDKSNDERNTDVKIEYNPEISSTEDISDSIANDNDGQISLDSLGDLPLASVIERSVNKSLECEQLLQETIKHLIDLQNDIKMDEDNTSSNFTLLGRQVSYKLSKMSTFNADCAYRKILEILNIYSDTNEDMV